ncbi:MAG TPA: SPOR domain-containing protein [Acidobacteriaceae bacterium]|jgi:cell division septation protein DedD|nr:SPOR domain-containing protein [Acidobacteriaceae bacterium]
MSLTYDTKEDLETRSRRSKARDRGDDSSAEITLGTRSLLGIFFGLVLICGIFFGLGYSVGRVGSARAATSPTDTPGPTTDGHLQKPAAGQQTLTPVTTPDNGSSGLTQDGAATPPPPNTQDTAAAPPVPGLTGSTAPAPGKNSGALTPAQTPAPTLTPAAITQPTTGPGNPFMVQVAAVRVQQDANILVSALKKHGYNAVVRNESQDALLHVQLGPFMTRADALAMRSRLLADGYNAVLK